MRPERRWDYVNPVRCLFGWGRLVELPSLVDGSTLVVTTPGMTRRGLTARICKLLGARRVAVFDQVESNPGIEAVESAVTMLGGHPPDSIVAVGGGSAMDFGKVLSVALAQSSPSIRAALDTPALLEGLQPLAMVAVPTTAGTGSEVTPFATVWDHAARRKLSLASRLLFPRVALLDPELTLSLPWDATLSPGLDALSQCFESIWNRNATPITTALALRGASLAPEALRRLAAQLVDHAARTDMMEASLLSGLAISRTRTALAHSMSYPLTAHFGLPHGLACAFTLPAVLDYNRVSDDGRLAELVLRLGCSDVSQVVDWLLQLFADLGVASAVRRYVKDYAAVYDLVPQMITPGRADNNLRPASFADVEQILRTTERWLFTV